jgi:hypothetical protein
MEAARKIEFRKRQRVPHVPPVACLACEASTGYRAVRVTKEVELKGDTLPVSYDCQECTNCGHRILSDVQMEARVRATVAFYQTRHGLLTAQEISSRRKALGYATQQALTDACPAIAIATLKRVEAGQHVQDPATDFTLRQALEKLESTHQQAEVIHLWQDEMPAAVEWETTQSQVIGNWLSGWKQALPLAACVTFMASTCFQPSDGASLPSNQDLPVEVGQLC